MVQRQYVITAKESQHIQITRLICAVLVVFIHAMPAVDIPADTQASTLTLYRLSETVRFAWVNCICSCAVPVFFIISAVLLFRKPFTWRENLRKKVRTLIIPYLLISTFWIVFYLVAQSIPITSVFFKTQDLRVSTWGFADWIKAYVGGVIKDPDRLYGPAMGWLWFLRDLFVLNVLAPLLKRIVVSARHITAVFQFGVQSGQTRHSF